MNKLPVIIKGIILQIINPSKEIKCKKISFILRVCYSAGYPDLPIAWTDYPVSRQKKQIRPIPYLDLNMDLAPDPDKLL